MAIPNWKEKFAQKLKSMQKVKVELDSIYVVQQPKVHKFKLSADSNSMGFAVFLRKEQLGLDLSPQQQSDVWMNSFIV